MRRGRAEAERESGGVSKCAQSTAKWLSLLRERLSVLRERRRKRVAGGGGGRSCAAALSSEVSSWLMAAPASLREWRWAGLK